MQDASIPFIEIDEDNAMPSRNHGRVGHFLSLVLDRFSDRFDILQQPTLNLDGWPSVPDMALFPKGVLSQDWETDDDAILIAPALAIEILSPKQNLGPLADKVRDYIKAGVKSCWIVEPTTRVVSVWPSVGKSRAFVDGDVVDEPLGIKVPISGIFR